MGLRPSLSGAIDPGTGLFHAVCPRIPEIRPEASREVAGHTPARDRPRVSSVKHARVASRSAMAGLAVRCSTVPTMRLNSYQVEDYPRGGRRRG